MEGDWNAVIVIAMRAKRVGQAGGLCGGQLGVGFRRCTPLEAARSKRRAEDLFRRVVGEEPKK